MFSSMEDLLQHQFEKLHSRSILQRRFINDQEKKQFDTLNDLGLISDEVKYKKERSLAVKGINLATAEINLKYSGKRLLQKEFVSKNYNTDFIRYVPEQSAKRFNKRYKFIIGRKPYKSVSKKRIH